MSDHKQTPVRVLAPDELAELREAHASLTAAQQRLTDAQAAVTDEETLFRAHTIRLQRRYGMALGDSIALDTGVVTAALAATPGAGDTARRPARGVGAAGTGLAGRLRPERGSRAVPPVNADVDVTRPGLNGSGAESPESGRVSGPNDLPGRA